MTIQTTKDAMLALMRFGAACLAEHRKDLTDLDGGWLQTLSVEAGLLELRFVNADCGPDCHDEHLFVRKEVLHLLAQDNLMDAWHELCNQRDAALKLAQSWLNALYLLPPDSPGKPYTGTAYRKCANELRAIFAPKE